MQAPETRPVSGVNDTDVGSLDSDGSGFYECPGCGDRLAGERRCDECNLFARRLGEGGCCPACSEIITITELLDIQ